MIHRRPDYQPSAYDDDFEDIPSSGLIPKWIGGVIIPAGLVVYGIVCFVTGHGELPGQFGSMTLTGTDAMALATAITSIGVFLHCHYFWGNIFHLGAWATLGKIASLLGIISGLGYLLVHVGVLGR